MPFLIYYVVKTVLDETNNWSIGDIHRLWQAAFFKDSENVYRENIAWILALAGEDKDKFMLLMERPGKLKQWWGSNLTASRFKEVFINLDRLFALSLDEIASRLDKINDFIFALEDETFVRLLCHHERSGFEADLVAAIIDGQYELIGISYGLRDRIKRFATREGIEIAASLLKNIKIDDREEDREAKLIPQSMAVIASLVGVPLLSPDESKVKAAWRKMSKALHPDHNPMDPEATKKFQNIFEAVNIYLAVLKEIETGEGLKDPGVNLLEAAL
ncbi:MAG: DnaJ domain-containing protein, partial [Candidatus Margulisbacteria bacterium]|nr:DnaJ domain-containing protein [Candidatus Margulisiibacteriota bacterium]